MVAARKAASVFRCPACQLGQHFLDLLALVGKSRIEPLSLSKIFLSFLGFPLPGGDLPQKPPGPVKTRVEIAGGQCLPPRSIKIACFQEFLGPGSVFL